MKNALKAVLLSLALCLFPCHGYSDGPREKIIAVASSLIGTTEATGHNDGAVVEAVLASVGLKKGNPYCAATNYFCYSRAGLGGLVPRSGWSPDWVRNPTWTPKSGGKTPLPADTWGIAWSIGGEFRVRHTGLTKEWRGPVVVTIEGNTSPDAKAFSEADRNGDGFWSKRRLTRQIFAVRNWIGP